MPWKHTDTRGKPRTRVIGHRGSAGTVPENTLESFDQAVLDGAEGLEMDVHLSADGEVVILHDPTVDRTTDGSGPVASMTVAQLKALDAGYRFTRDGGGTFPFRGQGLKIPTLEELLVRQPSAPIFLELKTAEPKLLRKSLELLARYNRLHDVTLIVYVLGKKQVRKLRTLPEHPLTGHTGREVAQFFLLSRLRLSFLFKRKSTVMQVPCRRGRVQVVTRNFVRQAHSIGMQVQVWTVDDEAEMAKYLSIGVDAIFTNFPGILRKIVDRSDI
jgi:glycerophosphoryl diester phosphodiesterase